MFAEGLEASSAGFGPRRTESSQWFVRFASIKTWELPLEAKTRRRNLIGQNASVHPPSFERAKLLSVCRLCLCLCLVILSPMIHHSRMRRAVRPKIFAWKTNLQPPYVEIFMKFSPSLTSYLMIFVLRPGNTNADWRCHW